MLREIEGVRTQSIRGIQVYMAAKGTAERGPVFGQDLSVLMQAQKGEHIDLIIPEVVYQSVSVFLDRCL